MQRLKRYFWFAFAGGTGFLVDAGVLQLLLWLSPIGPFVGRVISIAAAMASTWIINRTFTFDSSERHVADEGARYILVAVLAALFNYAVYSGCLLAFPQLWPVVAVAISSIAAMFFSYAGYSRFVFSK